MGSSHYYTPDGKLISGGLREARLCNGLVSPTTVLGMIKGPGLIKYLQRQMHEATATTPRNPSWTDDQYYNACEQWADEHSQAAKDKGLALHKLIQEFHQSLVGKLPMVPMVALTPELASGYDLYLRWYEKWVRKTIAVEQFVVGQGYAGREDHYCILNDGRSCLVDVKTQDISKRKRFNFYSGWSLQLGSYSGACPPELPERKVDCIISIAVSSAGPAHLEAKVWDRPPSYYHGLFMGLLALWQEENSYWATTTDRPVEALSV